MAKTVHVTHRGHGCWAVKSSDASRASSLHETKAKAVQAGRSLAISKGAELNVHNMNGRIAHKNSYGNDPFPPRG